MHGNKIMKFHNKEYGFFKPESEEVTCFIFKCENFCLTINKKYANNKVNVDDHLAMKYQYFNEKGEELNVIEADVCLENLQAFDAIVNAASHSFASLIHELKALKHPGCLEIAFSMELDHKIDWGNTHDSPLCTLF